MLSVIVVSHDVICTLTEQRERMYSVAHAHAHAHLHSHLGLAWYKNNLMTGENSPTRACPSFYAHQHVLFSTVGTVKVVPQRQKGVEYFTFLLGQEKADWWVGRPIGWLLGRLTTLLALSLPYFTCPSLACLAV